MSNTDERWKQRFDNMKKAFDTLRRAAAACTKEKDNDLYFIALIQSFKFSWELGWKTMKDYLIFQGVTEVSVPRDVIKAAFQHSIITDGQLWIDMLDDRNLMSHVYDEIRAKQAAKRIMCGYIPALNNLLQFFENKLSVNTSQHTDDKG